MARRKRSRFLNPQAMAFIFCMRALSDSAMALVEEVTTALSIPQRWFLMVLATFLTGASRQRSIQPSRLRHPFSAQVRDEKCQSFPACSLMAQARGIRPTPTPCGINVQRQSAERV